MKLDKMQFAWLVSYLTETLHNGNRLPKVVVESLDEIIDIEVPEPETQIAYPKNENVERLMMFMAGGTHKIDAIREHRAITGIGLKESKDAVERYWNIKMSADALKAKQIDALQRILDDCSNDLNQFNEEEIQVIKRWIEGFSV